MTHPKKPGRPKPHPPAKQRKGAPVPPPHDPKQALARIPKLPDRIEKLLMQGDLTDLTVEERLQFYKALCRSLGLNPLTRPFEYIVFTDREQDEETEGQPKPKGKMILYARADCAAQLRKIHRVGIRSEMVRRREGEFYICQADAFMQDRFGLRTDSATGIVWLKRWDKRTRQYRDLVGLALANAMMKAETKAKRRVTFSICGLHILDESELEDLTNITYEVSETGRVMQVAPEETRELPAATERHDVAVLLAQAALRKGDARPFAEVTTEEEKKLEKQTAAQLHVMYERLTGTEEKGRETPAAAQATAAPIQPEVEVKEDDYSGLTFAITPSGMYSIRGKQAVLHEHRTELRKYWMPHANPAGLYCRAEEAGRLMSQFEKNGVKCRMT